MVNYNQILIYVGIALVIVSILIIYYSHNLSSISYNNVNATTCTKVLSNIISGPLTSSRLKSLIGQLGRLFLISIEVRINYANGSSIKYGSYIPIGPSGVFVTPITSGNIEILGSSECSYIGDNYVVSVFIGEYPQSLYLFSIGIALLFIGFVLIALGDYLRDRSNRRKVFVK